MTTNIAKCGCDCFNCPTYKEFKKYSSKTKFVPFPDFKKSDIHSEIIPLIEKGWLTPTGGLKKEGCIMRLKFGESLKVSETLNNFKNYIMKLDKKYGNKAFSMFKKADIEIMVI